MPEALYFFSEINFISCTRTGIMRSRLYHVWNTGILFCPDS